MIDSLIYVFYIGYILIAVGILVKALCEPILGIVVVFFISQNVGNCYQFRTEVSAVISKYFQRTFEKFWRLVLLTGEDSTDGEVCFVEEESSSNMGRFEKCDFLDASPEEELVLPPPLPPTYNRRRRGGIIMPSVPIVNPPNPLPNHANHHG